MRRFDGVIFDMDGTLVSSTLDFAAIRAELGIEAGRGILEAIECMPPPKRRRCHQRLLEHELTAARAAQLAPSAAETLHAARQAGLKVALLTRNAGAAMEVICQRLGLEFDLAWSREHGPIKPEPDGVLSACRQLEISPARTACVGDYHYDIQAANAAGAVSVLLAAAKRPDYAVEADYVIERLDQLPQILGI